MFDISMTGAFLAGLLSFLSPCILPMVPFYLSYLGGMSAAELAQGGAVTRATRLRAVLGASVFAAGVLTVFVALGASASVFGHVLRDWFDVLRYIAAALIIAMGLHFLGVIRIGFLNRSLRAEPGDTANLGLGGAYLIGLAFAFGWTPCVGPVLAAILFMAGTTDTAGQGMARCGDDAALRSGGGLCRAFHEADGTLPAAFGQDRENHGRRADCFRRFDRDQCAFVYR